MMEIAPISSLARTSIAVPGSKSISNRALLIAALADGVSELTYLLMSDDTRYMMEALRAVGIRIDDDNGKIIVHGRGGSFDAANTDLFIGNAGTAMRFLTALSPLIPQNTVLTGNERMCERPISDLRDSLKKSGVDIAYMGREGYPPLRIGDDGYGVESITVRGDMSSQYLSALMMVAPYSVHGMTIRVEGRLVSKPYIDITLGVMKAFGIEVGHNDYQEFRIPQGCYTARSYEIEGDASSAGYFWGLGFLHDSDIDVMNITSESLQGDAQFRSLLSKVRNESPAEIDMNAMPDSALMLAVLLATLPRKTRIKNVYNLRVKETDRLHALATELRKVGAFVEEGEDYLDITGSLELHGAVIETYDDHRMAMSFGILGTKVPGIVIEDPGCVSKSYPNFFEDLSSFAS